MVHQIKTIKLVELNFIFKENALFERKSKAKKKHSWPLTLIMQKRDHFRLLRHHYSESPVIPLSNDIWYRCVAHGFITFYFLIFCRWSTICVLYLVTLLRPRHDRPTFVHGVVALFERSAAELFIVRHTADFLLVFT